MYYALIHSFKVYTSLLPTVPAAPEEPWSELRPLECRDSLSDCSLRTNCSLRRSESSQDCCSDWEE